MRGSCLSKGLLSWNLFDKMFEKKLKKQKGQKIDLGRNTPWKERRGDRRNTANVTSSAYLNI